MRDVLGAQTILGYCTNVHAGSDWDQFKTNLEHHAGVVKRIVSPEAPMAVGLWISAQAAREMLTQESTPQLSELLEQCGLLPFTFNGFPYADFHLPIVKHAVYRPTWADADRLEYTINLAGIMCDLLSDFGAAEGSISTVPLGWPTDFVRPAALRQAVANLRQLCRELRRMHDETGVLIHLDLEPEPGCRIQTSESLIEFMKSLLGGPHEAEIRQHLRVCHDVCHAAVMFEDQKTMFENYRAAGIEIGKVQISNAIRADFRNRAVAERSQIINELKQFSEDRYLHQTMISTGDREDFFEDLPQALSERGHTASTDDEWRTHFHVPVYLESFGLLKTTRDHIVDCFKLLKGSEVKHWEVETYAWNVLPPPLQVAELSEGIARELQWVRETATNLNLNQSAR
jgi:hypothetical protein